MQRTVELFFHDHRVTLEDGDLLCLVELEPLILEADCVVVVHGALGLDREDGWQPLSQLLRERTVGVTLCACVNTEAFVVIGQVRLSEKAIRRVAFFDASESQLFHQPVLLCIERALDPAFGLWRVGMDNLDPDLLHRSLELRHHLGVVDSALVVDLVGTESVHVYGHRKAVCIKVCTPEAEDCVYSFVVLEDLVRNGTRRVVDGVEEAVFSAVLEPVVVATVELDEFAVQRTALAPGTVDGVGTPHVRLPELFVRHDTAYGLTGERDVFLLRQLL